MQTDPTSQDVPTLFRRLSTRDPEAFGELYRRLYVRLRDYARLCLRREPELDPIYDEDDAIDSAYEEIWGGLTAGKLSPPGEMGEFLHLARMNVEERIRNKARESKAAKRRRPSTDRVDVDGAPEIDVPNRLDLLAADLLAPETSVILDDQVTWLMSLLRPELRAVADLRRKGHRAAEIAVALGISSRSVERMSQHIREIRSEAERDL